MTLSRGPVICKSCECFGIQQVDIPAPGAHPAAPHESAQLAANHLACSTQFRGQGLVGGNDYLPARSLLQQAPRQASVDALEGNLAHQQDEIGDAATV